MVEIKRDVIKYLINYYCREPGIRSLEKYSKKLIEKVLILKSGCFLNSN